MRDKYFSMYVRIKHQTSYYEACQARARRALNILDAACLVVMSSSVAGWGIWNAVPVLWIILIATAQVVALLKPKLPYSAQLVTTRFIIPELKKLLIDIDTDWSFTHEMTDEKISRLVRKYESLYEELEARFAGDVYLPQKGRLVKQAKSAVKTFFYQRYGVTMLD